MENVELFVLCDAHSSRLAYRDVSLQDCTTLTTASWHNELIFIPNGKSHHEAGTSKCIRLLFYLQQQTSNDDCSQVMVLGLQK